MTRTSNTDVPAAKSWVTWLWVLGFPSEEARESIVEFIAQHGFDHIVDEWVPYTNEAFAAICVAVVLWRLTKKLVNRLRSHHR